MVIKIKDTFIAELRKDIIIILLKGFEIVMDLDVQKMIKFHISFGALSTTLYFIKSWPNL